MNKVFTAVLCLALAVIVHSEEDKKLVYGTDDRTEPYSITNANVLNLIQADVALMYASQLSKKSNSYRLSQKGTYDGVKCPNSYLEFCSNEPFKGQTQAAFCSGFLVRNDVNSSRIVTAGHCLNGFDCGQMAFIFDFAQESSSSINLDFPKSNVYFCKSFYFELDETSNMDFGVVELDRQVSGRDPLTLRTSGTVTVGTPLYMVGHPTGIPMKVAGGATVKSVSGVRFTGNTDSYAGNSGSMIVNANTWQVEGILVEGNQDFKESGGCCVSNVCSDVTGCPSFEVMSQISQVEDYLYADLPYAEAWNMQPLMLLVVVLTFLAL